VAAVTRPAKGNRFDQEPSEGSVKPSKKDGIRRRSSGRTAAGGRREKMPANRGVPASVKGHSWRFRDVREFLLKLDRIDCIAFALAMLVVFSQVLILPAIGLADNGDFAKIAGRFNLHPKVEERDAAFYYANTWYVSDPKYHWDSGFTGSETGLALLAVLAGKAYSGNGTFDIRFLGVLHSALFLAAFALALPLFHAFRKSSRCILIALALIVFGDVMYVAYYNSFFMDTAAFLFLLCAAVLFLRACYLPSSKPSARILFLVCSCLFLLTKAQHAPLFVPLIFFSVQTSVLLAPSRPVLSRCVAIGSLFACGVFAFLNPPRGYTTAPLYNLIFFGLIPSAERPNQELKELGLDDSYLRYMGTWAYSVGSPLVEPDYNWEATFLRRTSYGKIGLFYLRHPLRAASILGVGLAWAIVQRPPNLGNFDKSAAYPPGAQSRRFSLWSAFKATLFKDHPWAYLTYFLVLIAMLAQWRPGNALFLGIMASMALAIGALTDAADPTRHLFLFNFLLDFIVICVVAALLKSAERHVRARNWNPPASGNRAAISLT
jgi:hypothetical protein